MSGLKSTRGATSIRGNLKNGSSKGWEFKNLQTETIMRDSTSMISFKAKAHSRGLMDQSIQESSLMD